MTLGVVMATYDGGRYVGEQLASIAGQTRPPDVLVISDDGSSDDTWAQAERFAASAPFTTRLVRGPGRGLAENFWSAAELAGTDLIAWSDQDDVWRLDKLAACERALRDPAIAFVSHSAQTIDDRGQPLRRRYPDYRATATLGPLEGDPWHVPSGFASMFRASLLDDVRFAARPRSHQTERAMNHDHVVSLRAFEHPRRELAEVLAGYRQHDANAAGDPTPSGIEAVRQTVGPRATQFTTLAAIAAEQGAFLAVHGGAPATATYFAALRERCLHRARIYDAATLGRRAGALRRATAGRAYEPRRRGGFGARAFARDAGLSMALSLGR